MSYWAGVLEVWTWTITVQKEIHKWAGECTKIRTSRPKNENIFWTGALLPLQTVSNREGDTSSPYPHPHILSAPAPLGPLNPNPGSAPDLGQQMDG